MKNLIFSTVQRVSGAILVIFGLNIFLQFIPMPQPSAQMGVYLGALFQTGYIFPIAGIIEITTGLAFLFNRFVPLALILITPIILNAFLAHLFLDISGIGAAAFVLFAIILVTIKNIDSFKTVFVVKN